MKWQGHEGKLNISESENREKEDKGLLRRFLKNRDEASFRALYRSHTPALLLFAVRLVGGTRHEAEDAVQEAWLRAVQGVAGFRQESNFSTWLCGITINCCREVVRRRRATPSGAGQSIQESSMPSRELAATLEQLLRRLPDGYREVLLLHDVEGYTHEEIARLLGISSGTSKSQLSHARRTLRAQLERYEVPAEVPGKKEIR